MIFRPIALRKILPPPGAVASGFLQATAMALMACCPGTQGKSAMGASGLLDRVDALSFVAPVFFYFVHWYFAI